MDGLGLFDGKRVTVTVIEEDTTASLPDAPRRFGTLAGQFVVPDDFDAPLPEELLAAFEGREGA